MVLLLDASAGWLCHVSRGVCPYGFCICLSFVSFMRSPCFDFHPVGVYAGWMVGRGFQVCSVCQMAAPWLRVRVATESWTRSWPMDVWSLDSWGILENDKENVLMNPTKVVFSVFFTISGFRGHSFIANPKNSQVFWMVLNLERTSDWTLPHGNVPNWRLEFYS